jgi:hypothetical protein
MRVEIMLVIFRIAQLGSFHDRIIRIVEDGLLVFVVVMHHYLSKLR